MKIFGKILLSCLLPLASQAWAAPVVTPASVDIISPEVADGFFAAPSYNRRPDTGQIVICLNPGGECATTEWLTPQQAVTKKYPKATYVGFRVIRMGHTGLEVLLFYRSKQ